MRRSPFALAFGTELRLLGREPSVWIATGLFTVLCVYAAATGIVAWRQTMNAVRQARQTQAKLLEDWKQEAGSGKLVTKGARGSRADSPYFVSAQRLPYGIAPPPLAAMQTSALSARTWVDDLHAWRSQPDLFHRDDLANPLLLQLGSLDVNLLIVYLLPLLIGGLAARGQSADRSSGIQDWIESQSGRGRAVLAGKLAAVFVLCMAPVAIAAVLAGGAAAGKWLLLVAVYALFWLGVAAGAARNLPAVSGYMILVVAAWMGLALVAPLARSLILDAWAPPYDPGSAAVARQAVDLRMAGSRDSDEALLRASHPEWFGATAGDQREMSILASFLAAERELLKDAAAAEHAWDARARLSRRLAWMSPSVLISDGLTEASGADDATYDAARAGVQARLQELRGLLFPMVLQGKKMDAARYDRLLAGVNPAAK